MGVPQPLQGQCWGEAKAGKRGFIFHAAPWERGFIFHAISWEREFIFPGSTLGSTCSLCEQVWMLLLQILALSSPL